jgi:hypothetical protein
MNHLAVSPRGRAARARVARRACHAATRGGEVSLQALDDYLAELEPACQEEASSGAGG